MKHQNIFSNFQYTSCLRHFGLDTNPTSTTMHFFGALHKFVTQFNACQQQLHTERLDEQRARQRSLARAQFVKRSSIAIGAGWLIIEGFDGRTE
jgi:hypothetical protein